MDIEKAIENVLGYKPRYKKVSATLPHIVAVEINGIALSEAKKAFENMGFRAVYAREVLPQGLRGYPHCNTEECSEQEADCLRVEHKLYTDSLYRWS